MNTPKSSTYLQLRVALWRWNAKLQDISLFISQRKVLSDVKQLAYSEAKQHYPYYIISFITIVVIRRNYNVPDISHGLS